MVSFLDLQKVNAQYRDALVESCAKVVDSGWYIYGESCRAFEKNFAQYCGVKYCVGVANGLDALVLILRAYIELGKLSVGDEVLVPANTYIASVLAISETGLIPVLVEPVDGTMLLDPGQMVEKISVNTRAVMPVHLYGRVCDMGDILKIAEEYDLLVIEDSAQSHGAQHVNGRRCGALGNASGFSFYPGKNLGALGDGGAVTTNDEELAVAVRAIANYGSHAKYEHSYMGVNSRLDEIQAAMLSVKLKHIDTEILKRRKVALSYLSGIVNPDVVLPNEPELEGSHVWHLFVVRTNHREKFMKHMLDSGVETMSHYPIPLYSQKAYEGIFESIKLPITEMIHSQVVSLPLSPVITPDEVECVIAGVNSYRG